MFHWTDSKIQVHAFCCVLALPLTSLLPRELARKGEPLCINRMLEELGGIRETLVVYPRRQGHRPAPTATLSYRNKRSSTRFLSRRGFLMFEGRQASSLSHALRKGKRLGRPAPAATKARGARVEWQARSSLRRPSISTFSLQSPTHCARKQASFGGCSIWLNHMSMPEQVLKKDNVKAGLKEIGKDLVYEAFAKGRPEEPSAPADTR